MKMMPLWKWSFGLAIYFLIHINSTNSQATTLPSTTTFSNTLELTTPTTTTFVPTLTPLLTTEATTLATADSELPTTSFPTEESTVEATTEGQASNDDLRSSGLRRGYRFESTRTDKANQEAEPETEITTTQKPEEKKIAWKFGRGGNNQEPWSSRPSPNSGFPVWKKEPPASGPEEVEQNAEGVVNKPNDQGGYIVWNVGQGNQQNGWTLGGIPPNAGWVAADGNAENSPEEGSWNAGGWTEDQSSETGEGQGGGGWSDDDAAPDDGSADGWDNSGVGGWNQQNQNAAGWVNGAAQRPSGNGQSPNSWQPQDNSAGGGTWIVNPQQQGNNGQGGWVTAQQSGGWGSQTPEGGSNGVPNGGWNNNGGGWVAPPASQQGNSWEDSGPPQSDKNGWNNNQQNAAGWNAGNGGSPGWQDGNMSWKVYNEDTKTMENIDDNSGWKVVGDGGPDGWKLINENGNIEWKIENINGEWKVTSADEFPSTNASVSSLPGDSVNATLEATNDTSVETNTTPQPPPGGWDDDKQGRYIIWKFSDNGKGEARVYDGPGSEPEVWTVGDNNQWWKETMGIKESGAAVQGGYNTGGGKWQNNGGWQNTAPQAVNSYQNGGGNAAPQNGQWQSGGASQSSGTSWQKNRPSANGGGVWRNNNPATKTNGNGWQTGGSQRKRNRWQNRGGSTTQQKWRKGVPSPQSSNAWQNQATQSGSWNAGNTAPAKTNGWQNPRSGSQPANGNRLAKQTSQQSGWQNGATRNGGGWTNGGQAAGRKAKSRWRSNANRPSGRWVSNNANGVARNGAPKGKVWNSGNGWQTAPGVQPQEKTGWANVPASSEIPPVATQVVSGRSIQNDQNKAPQTTRWSGNGERGQTVPYIIVIKSPEAGTNGVITNPAATASKKSKNSNPAGNTKPSSNRRNGGYKMNRAGSSGWVWNPQGGNEGWQWRDGWMGSGGGFGGWSNDGQTMYSSWKPAKINGAQVRRSSIQRSGSDKANKKSGSKMVFVFGTKRSSEPNVNQPAIKGKKGKQVIIIDYSSGGKKAPKGDDDMKKDIESVIQTLKTAKPTGVRGTAGWKQSGQRRQSQQWST